MDRKTYDELMATIEAGAKLDPATHAELTAFAKEKKIKRPAADAVLTAEDVAAADTATEPKATKVKAEKKDCDVTAEQDPKMTTAQCDKKARSNGKCPKHYTRLIHRANPVNAEKAREASRRYAAKLRAAKEAAKALEAEAAVEVPAEEVPVPA